MLLAIDTSGPFCSAAIATKQTIIFSCSENIGRGHAERLMPMLEEMLLQSKVTWQEITQIACVTGPGSFTGLRVGIAAAKGLSLALLCPCRGVSVFEAFAASIQNTDVKKTFAVIMDAKRDQVWMQIFNEAAQPTGTPMAVSTDRITSKLPTTLTDIYGSGAAILAKQNKAYTLQNSFPSPPIEGVVLKAFAGHSAENTLKPLYLRDPDAKPQTTAVINQ